VVLNICVEKKLIGERDAEEAYYKAENSLESLLKQLKFFILDMITVD